MKLLLALALVVAVAEARCPNSCSGHGTCGGGGIYDFPQAGLGWTQLNNAGAASDPNTDYGGSQDICTCFTRKAGDEEREDLSQSPYSAGDGTNEGGTGASGSAWGNKNGAQEIPAWTGADCSLRVCPFAAAWVDTPWTNSGGHYTHSECSNMGMCDRKSGECKCFAGYTGRACQYTTCMDDCNGRGTCQTMNKFYFDLPCGGQATGGANTIDVSGSATLQREGCGADTPLAVDSSNAANTELYKEAFDAYKHQGCLCDYGFRGPSCELVECPSDHDPMHGEGSVNGRDCSGRGICDYSSGMCECFSGFYGTSCNMQTALL